MIPSAFLKSFPDDVVQVVESRTVLLSLTSIDPDQSMQERLTALNATETWKTRLKSNQPMAQAALSGIWLWFGFLDTAHQICQAIPTAEGSYWHGIMHRIECDYWNAKYWMGRTGSHPIHSQIPTVVDSMPTGDTLSPRVTNIAMPKSIWNPEGFIDACENANQTKSDLSQDCEILATAEWKALMAYCLNPMHYS